MYKIWIYVFILYACIPNIFAQNQSEVDSLKAVLKSEINSSQKVDTYLTLAQYFSRKNARQSKEYNEKAIQLVKSTNYSDGLIRAYSLQVTFFTDQKQFKKA